MYWWFLRPTLNFISYKNPDFDFTRVKKINIRNTTVRTNSYCKYFNQWAVGRWLSILSTSFQSWWFKSKTAPLVSRKPKISNDIWTEWRLFLPSHMTCHVQSPVCLTSQEKLIYLISTDRSTQNQSKDRTAKFSRIRYFKTCKDETLGSTTSFDGYDCYTIKTIYISCLFTTNTKEK